jgi:hypothetical protein
LDASEGLGTPTRGGSKLPDIAAHLSRRSKGISEGLSISDHDDDEIEYKSVASLPSAASSGLSSARRKNQNSGALEIIEVSDNED